MQHGGRPHLSVGRVTPKKNGDPIPRSPELRADPNRTATNIPLRLRPIRLQRRILGQRRALHIS